MPEFKGGNHILNIGKANCCGGWGGGPGPSWNKPCHVANRSQDYLHESQSHNQSREPGDWSRNDYDVWFLNVANYNHATKHSWHDFVWCTISLYHTGNECVCMRVMVIVVCHSVCVCVCVTALAATYLFNIIITSKVRRHTFSCRLLSIANGGLCWKRFVREIWYHLPVMMIGDSALSQHKTHQWLLTRLYKWHGIWIAS